MTTKSNQQKQYPEGKVLKRIGPAVRMIANGEPVWYLDFRFTDAQGKRKRFRQKADVQTQTGATREGEERKAKALRCGDPSGPLELDVPAVVETAPVNVGPKPWAERTLNEAVDVYFKSWAPANLAPMSRFKYKAALRAAILPRFGETPIGKIDKPAVAKWDGDLAAAGMIAPTRRRLHVVLRSVICKCAVSLGWFTEPPRMPKMPSKSDIDPDVLSDEEVNAILEVITPRQRLAFLLASDAGLRPAEVRELRWRDVQTKTWVEANGSITEGLILRVRRGFAAGEVTATKTGVERCIPVTPRLAAALGPRGDLDKLVSTNARGARWIETGLDSNFKPAVRRAKVEGDWRYYDLRHYFCTSLFRARVNPRIIMDLMGHRNLATTLRYAHVVQDDLLSAISAMSTFTDGQVRRAAAAASAVPLLGLTTAQVDSFGAVEVSAHGRPMTAPPF